MKAVSVIAHVAVFGLLIGLGVSVRWLTSLDPMARYTQEYAGAGMGEAVVRLERITAESRKGMVREWRMSAAEADVDRSGYYWNLRQVHRASLFDQGREALFLTTDTARWDGVAQELLLGPLEVTREGYRLSAQRGHWQQRRQRLDLAGPIRLASADADGVASSVAMGAASNTLIVTDGRLLLAQAAIPEIASSPKPQSDATADTRRRVEIQFKRFIERQGKTREGEGVTVKDGDAVFTADRAEQDIPGRRVTATGNLRMTEPRAEGTGDKLEIDLKDKLAVLTGNVRFTLKPRSSAAPSDPESNDTRTLSTELRKPVQIVCDRAENRYRDKQVTLTGSLKLTQTIADGKQRVLTADKAVYDERTETVVLSGNVYGKDEKGQELRMPRVTIGVKEGDEWVRAEDGGTIVVFDEDEDSGSSTPTQPTAPAGSEPPKPKGAPADETAPDKRGD